VIVSVLPGLTLAWLLLLQGWILLLWLSRNRSPFARRLDQLLALLVLGTGPTSRRTLPGALESGVIGALRRSARRWRSPLRALYGHGYQVALETISASGEVAGGSELLQAAVAALNAERTGGSAGFPGTDPVVVLAYGLGAWPSEAATTSLDELLAKLGVSQPELRRRFESLLRTIPTAAGNRAFRELAGASFVLGAAARILEAATATGGSVPPVGWIASIKMYLR
jgi:hypothetical protein